jgi:hypothetical protein
MSAVNYALTAPADFLQQFVVTEVSQHFCCSRTVFRAFILVVKQTKAGL